jgi:ABC-type Na+ efflux pump permease subunit
MVPRFLARLGVLAFALVLIYTGLTTAMGQNFTHALHQLDFGAAYEMYQRIESSNRLMEEVVIMGVVVLVLGPLVTFVRCAGSVSEEKRRKTWEDLLLTPLSIDEILTGKLWGVVSAGTEYLAFYAVPMLALSLLAGVGGVFLALVFIVLTWLGMLATASMGIGYSRIAAEGSQGASRRETWMQS